MKSARMYALGGVLAIAALLPQCSIGKGGTDVLLYSSMTVFHKAEGPGGQQIPWVRAVGKAVINTPPRGGTVTVTLWYRRTLLSGWKFAGRAHIGNPWVKGTRQVVINYVCLYDKSWWRINYVWDAILHDGTPDKSPRGGENWPNSRGMRLTCQVIQAPMRAVAR